MGLAEACAPFVIIPDGVAVADHFALDSRPWMFHQHLSGPIE